MQTPLAELSAELLRLDWRSHLLDLAVADRLEAELAGFGIERSDHRDASGVPKRALAARRGGPGGLALSGPMDMVPDTGWTDDPWGGRIEAVLPHGLGSADMTGAVAARAVAARGSRRATLLRTTDEETTKHGAAAIAERSVLARGLDGIAVAEPTGLAPARGHRSSTKIVATARGAPAHSSTGAGGRADWARVPLLAEMRAPHERLRESAALLDGTCDPPCCDFNLVLDNHGTAVAVTPARANARFKVRRSARVDPAPILAAVREAAARGGLERDIRAEGSPPELREGQPPVLLAARRTGAAPRTKPCGTDASERQALARCLILGPATVETARPPRGHVRLAQLERAAQPFARMLGS